MLYLKRFSWKLNRTAWDSIEDERMATPGNKTTLQELADWSSDLSDWLSDAARRAVQQGTLAPSDFDDLTALVMETGDIPDPFGRKAVRLDPSMIPAAAEAGAAISLTAIREPINVNALDHPTGITFEREGLTIIYGQNGAGKSGYARLLKRACRARDQEMILPNIFSPPAEAGPARALFEWHTGGVDQKGPWIDGAAPHNDLSAVAVFDGRCARVFVDDEQEVSVVPYGVDVLREMVRTCVEVKIRLEKEHQLAQFDLTTLVPLHGETAVGRFVQTLHKGSDREEIKRLATLTDDEKRERDTLVEKLKDDPARKATALRKLSTRLKALETELDEAASPLSDKAVENFRVSMASYKAADEASQIAANDLTDGGNALPGTGSDPWRELMGSAMTFAQSHAYPGQSFPAEADGTQCVLCQQPLSPDARDRLRHFVKFLEADTQKKRTERRAATALLYKPIETAKPESVPADKTLLDEISERNADLPGLVRAHVLALKNRQTHVLEMAKAREIGSLDALPDAVIPKIQELYRTLDTEAAELDKIQQNEERIKLQAQLRELDARLKLADMLPSVEKAINSLVFQSKLADCIKDTGTTGITRKSTELTEAALAKGLNEALESELKRLNLVGMKVGIDLRGQKGKGLQQLKLAVPKSMGKIKLSDVLSEGEQRAIAIGCFLAEISLLPNGSGIVFDDPVSSVDNSRRELIAQRFAEEARTRQVVVFTHDLCFAWDLTEAASKSGAKCKASRVYAAGGSKGVTEEGLPFEAGKLGARVNALQTLAIQAKNAMVKDKDLAKYELLVRDGYRKLRDTWERLIEEGLFGDTVRRFRNSVKTLLLKKAFVDDQDFQEVFEGMSRCSNYTHDGPLESAPPLPAPDDFIADVERLKSSYDRITARAQRIEEERGKLVPQAKSRG